MSGDFFLKFVNINFSSKEITYSLLGLRELFLALQVKESLDKMQWIFFFLFFHVNWLVSTP